MKKWLAMMAVLAMAFAFVRCDFGEEDDATEATEDVAETPKDTGGNTPTGDCKVGESADYAYVMIEDSSDNPTLVDCNTNPGADIDSICIYRADSNEGCASEVAYTPVNPVPCEQNDKDDPEQVLGAPDGIAGNGEFKGYFSLNGGWIIVGFDAGLEILCGDVIEVIEMHNEEDPDATVEQYRTSLGEGSDCLGEGLDCRWSLESDWAVGHDEIDVTWVW